MPQLDLTAEMAKRHANLECLFCGRALNGSSSFYRSASRHDMLRVDNTGKTRLLICTSCAQTFFDYLLKMYRTPEKAMYQFCAAMDVGYFEELLEKLKKTDVTKYVGEYFKLLDTDYKYSDKTFADTVNLMVSGETYGDPTTEEEGLNEEDQRNRREILNVFHYDPFEREPIEDRKKLYRDLVTMADPAMADDLVRQRAAIEIVRSFMRIDKWTETINQLSADPQSMVRNSKQIQELVATKNKETDMVTKFSKDHGFAERYATAKSRGTGTLSATIRDMEDFDYDDGKVNRYDILTSGSMQQAAEISTAAIMKQLGLSEADYADMLKQQRERLTTLELDLERTKEELRLVYKQITKQELLKELATELHKKGLAQEEITGMVLAEIKYEDDTVKEMKKNVKK